MNEPKWYHAIMKLSSVNPATGKVIKTYATFSKTKIFQTIKVCEETFQKWRKTDFQTRGKLMRNAAKILRKNIDVYATLMTKEMGKPITQSKAEIEKCAWNCEYFAENAEGFLQDAPIKTEAKKSYVHFEPLGVIFAIMPWNFPFWQVFRFAVPTLMAGNTAVLKHASNVSGCALAIERIFQKAGFPRNVFRTLLIPSSKIEDIIAHRSVRAVTITGSSAAGRNVAALAGKYLKKAVLELGGSDPFIVLDDVNVFSCAKIASQARNLNSGQSCIAAKRFIVFEKIAKKFEELFAKYMESAVIGDPMDPKTQIGPMAREDLLKNLDRQVKESVKKGAKLLAGGKRLNRPGYFYTPTVLSHVKKGMPVYDEETFGPVAAVIRVKNAKQAIAVANDTFYGLGASIWTKDRKHGEKFTREIEAGAVFVNGIVKSDPRLPFGGVKESGYGRELSSYGIKEFVNIQSVTVA